MMIRFLYLLLAVNCFSFPLCAQIKLIKGIPDGSYRNLQVVRDSLILLSGSNGRVVLYHTESGFMDDISPQMRAMDFRSGAALNDSTILVANAGSPAYILRTTNRGQSWDTVWYNNHEKVFIDGMQFWDRQTGLVYGDPIDDHLFIMKTTDGGTSWFRIPEHKAIERQYPDEAGFAASNTGLITLPNGNAAVTYSSAHGNRILTSGDMGHTWNSYTTQLANGEGCGVFALGMSKKQLVMVGGCYARDTVNTKTGGYLRDGQFIPASVHPNGYRSGLACRGKTCISTGTSGTDISFDGGKTWEPWLGMAFHVVRIHRNRVYFAGSGGRVALYPLPVSSSDLGRNRGN